MKKLELLLVEAALAGYITETGGRVHLTAAGQRMLRKSSVREQYGPGGQSPYYGVDPDGARNYGMVDDGSNAVAPNAPRALNPDGSPWDWTWGPNSTDKPGTGFWTDEGGHLRWVPFLTFPKWSFH